MAKRFPILFFALICAIGSLAADYTVETVPNVQLYDAQRFTTNPDGIISAATQSEIDRMCGELRDRQLAEVVVLVLDGVDESSLDMFAHSVLNRWGVGQKGKDNGLVISVVRRQRDIQFETGYGLEGVLPDALCKRIQMTYMVEPLGAGDFDKGVLDGVTAVYNVLTDNEAELTALKAAGDRSDNQGGRSAPGFLLLLLVPIGLFSLVITLIYRRENTCPVCHTVGGLRLIKHEVVSRSRGVETIRSTYRCRKCGHIVTRTSRRNTGGAIIGGGFGGSHGGFGGGGGFSGGGFGGGRSGGGGARSGF